MTTLLNDDARNRAADTLWRRARDGKHSAVVGLCPVPLTDAAAGLDVARVSCAGPTTTRGPLEVARAKIVRFLGDELALDAQATELPLGAIHRRLLGGTAPATPERALVEAFHKLSRRHDRPVALVLDAVDLADDATLRALARLVRSVPPLRVPLVLSFGEEPTGAASEVLEAVRTTSGEGAVLRFGDLAIPADAGGRPSPARVRERYDWAALEPESLRVLRAGAVAGTVFEAELVAALLELPVEQVLDALQRATDHGAPIADTGDGRFSLPPGAASTLQDGTLPSLVTRWHRRLAALLAPTPRPALPTAPGLASPAELEVDEETTAPAPGSPGRLENLFEDPEANVITNRVLPPLPRAAATPPVTSGHEVAPAPPAPDATPDATLPAPTAMPLPHASVSSPESPAEDAARAATHLLAAREVEAAAERYLAAATELAAKGDDPRAMLLARKAFEALDRVPASDARAVLRARALMHIGRAQARGAALDASEPTLPGALETLEQARAALPRSAPVVLRAELGALIADVCFDIGDASALDRALAELTDASHLLLEAGEAKHAARLLNDQAAIYLRMGDPVRAMALLERSREVFGGMRKERPDDPVALEELAETDHLTARVLLEARVRPGRERDACSLGLDHARAAEGIYRALGRRRQLARVWETMARLETRRGRLDRAAGRAAAALELQQGLGDVIGLARSTDAMADLLLAAGQPERALEALGQSLELNLEHGSPIGLAFNRRAIDAFRQRVEASGAAGDEQRVAGSLERLERRLEEAEHLLGRLVLPGESG